jgi:hypothetical protein
MDIECEEKLSACEVSSENPNYQICFLNFPSPDITIGDTR